MNKFWIFPLLFLFGCNSSSNEIESTSSNFNEQKYEWIVSKNHLTGSDNPFPFVSNPTMNSIEDVVGLLDEDTVVLISFKNEIKAYPYKFISPYEVVNDHLENIKYAITYCPVTESGICVNNTLNNESISLVASGFRYKDNLVSFDENTNTYWSQMLLKCIKGQFENNFHEQLPMIETKWKNVKKLYPTALVFTPSSINQNSNKTQFKQSSNTSEDERVFGVLDVDNISDIKIHIYRKNDFENEIKIYQKYIGNNNTVIIGNKELDFIVSFIDSGNSEFAPIQNEFPIIMQDNSGSKWNVFGVAVSGSRTGENLSLSKSYLASWWAWKDFYSEFIHIN